VGGLNAHAYKRRATSASTCSTRPPAFTCRSRTRTATRCRARPWSCSSAPERTSTTRPSTAGWPTARAGCTSTTSRSPPSPPRPATPCATISSDGFTTRGGTAPCSCGRPAPAAAARTPAGCSSPISTSPTGPATPARWSARSSCSAQDPAGPHLQQPLPGRRYRDAGARPVRLPPVQPEPLTSPARVPGWKSARGQDGRTPAVSPRAWPVLR
jgi:hypothetical protein